MKVGEEEIGTNKISVISFYADADNRFICTCPDHPCFIICYRARCLADNHHNDCTNGHLAIRIKQAIKINRKNKCDGMEENTITGKILSPC